MKNQAIRAAILASFVALFAALTLAIAWTLVAGGQFRWALLGWAATSIPGIIGIGWMTRNFGIPGNSFLAAMATAIAARFGLAMSGALLLFFLAPDEVTAAAISFSVGIAFGYVPLFLFEAVWFLRLARRGAGTMNAAGSEDLQFPLQANAAEGNRC